MAAAPIVCQDTVSASRRAFVPASRYSAKKPQQDREVLTDAKVHYADTGLHSQ